SPLLWLVWLAVLGPLVVLLVTYVIWKYVRDCQAIGWLWGLMLMFLRCCVYLILVLAFLRPALQPWEVIQLHSRVALGLDTSLSMSTTRDDVPTDETPPEKLPTRQDKVLAFLEDPQVTFLDRLTKKNPVFVYRFGRGLDEDYHVLTP